MPQNDEKGIDIDPKRIAAIVVSPKATAITIKIRWALRSLSAVFDGEAAIYS